MMKMINTPQDLYGATKTHYLLSRSERVVMAAILHKASSCTREKVRYNNGAKLWYSPSSMPLCARPLVHAKIEAKAEKIMRKNK